MGNLIRMDQYRMRKVKGFWICLGLAFLISLGYVPLAYVMLNLAKSLSSEVTDVFPATFNLYELIGNPLTALIIMLCLLSVAFFFYADMENGYIKNIAGQMPKRGFSILSRFLAVIEHNLIFMLTALVGQLIGSMIFQRMVTEGSLVSAVLMFLLRLLLLQSLCSILLLVSSSLRSKSAGVVLAVLLGIPAMELLYTAIDSGLRMLLNQPTFTIAPYMPDVLLREGKPDTLRAILSSAVTIGIFLSLSISVFDKRDVK